MRQPGWNLSSSELLASLLLLVTACARAAAAPGETKLPPGVQLVSAASQRAELCESVSRQDLCEDFRDVPPQEVLRFEQRFPELLKARGYPREAERLATFDRAYWGVFSNGRLEVLGSLVCPERLAQDSDVVLLEPNPGGGCSVIRVTFPAGHPEQAAFTVE